ncbi:cellulase family glycosylhydrolase [Glycomyces sp. YM15]|uniref:cellulase family glycosylhydrolase n=1 Tax=Glycomyces sp. YM15 TaxID=2800446 RepID=UPI001964B6C3|nr:cellulase family glycosylhydrolase [Glycomyces sp. YM15]
MRLLLAAPLALSPLALPATSQAQDAEPQTAEEIVAAMQPGWNLGNSFDSMCCGDEDADETTWGNPRPDERFFESLRAEGFNSIRMPVSWNTHTGPAPDYEIDPKVMARVQEVVDLALAEGFYVMINTHHDSWQYLHKLSDPEQHDAVMAQFDATWVQISETFEDYPQQLVFEAMNEVGWGDTATTEQSHVLMAELNRSFHEIVRGSGGGNDDRLLVLETIYTSADQVHLDALAAEIEALDDPMLAATTHNYGYWPFSVNIAGGTKYTEEYQGYLEENFQTQVDTFVSRGIPVIIGEYGLLDGYGRSVERGEYLKFFEHFGYLARTSGITTMWWDNGTHYDRFKREWRDQEQFDYISSSWTTRSGTASSDLVFVDSTDKVTDKSVTLNRNGLDFTGLYFGNIELKEGKDFTLEGDTLTVKAKVLKYILGDRAVGTKAQLQVRFSAGMPWKLNVISYENPVQEDATGTAESVLIPTRFNGDQLATMEAVYADGTAAGPHDWTTYKAFWEAFRPNYKNNTIQLTKALLDEFDEGAPVTLRFHFWSGAVLEYTVTKNGDVVTGTVA